MKTRKAPTSKRLLVALALLVATAANGHALTGATRSAQPLAQQYAVPTVDSVVVSGAALRANANLAPFTRHFPGTWEMAVDTRTSLPAVIRGNGIELLSKSPTQREVELAARAFAAQVAPLWGVRAEDLALDYAEYAKSGIWVARFHQLHQSLPVWKSRLQLTFKAGRLVLVRADLHPRISVGATPRVSATAAASRVAQRYSAAFNGARQGSSPTLYVYPQQRGVRTAYALAWNVESATANAEIGALVDAATGDILEAVDLRAYADVTGTVSGSVDRRTVGDPQDTILLDGITVSVSSLGSASASDKGAFTRSGSSGGSHTVTASLSGSRIKIDNQQGADGSASASGTAGSSIGLQFTNSGSDVAERDAYRALTATNRLLQSVFPSNSWISSSTVTAAVNIADACNAYWSPWAGTVNFFQYGTYTSQTSGRKLTCNNTGRIFDVMSHELGHGADQNLPGGAWDGGLGEGIGDMLAMLQTRSPEVGPGFIVAIDGVPTNEAVRYLDDAELNCYDSSVSEVHDQGEMLGQVLYDIMTDLTSQGVKGQVLRDIMVLPIADAQTRTDWYDGLLVADDDDGNLANGTPHGCTIWGQFNAHSCGSQRWPGVPTSAVACYSSDAGGRSTYESADTGVAIPDGDPAGVVSTLEVGDSLSISDLDVYVEIDHSFAGDLTLLLSGPASGTVRLQERSGSSTDDIGGAYGRELTPVDSLDAFKGQNAQGTWQLFVADDSAQDVGTLQRWRLEIR
ncbi:MAG: proprotein convertase P-domain-containing protein [Candidatus Schekmanbacteria bacterium]|nr:proprotein convertase P-domain-containing protein [Candidatus Schekmanbacteria bacterium]